MVLVILRKKANKKTKGRQARSWWLILSEVTWEPLLLNEPFLPQVWETIKVYSTSLPFLPWRPALKIASQRPTLTTHMNSQLLSRSEDMYMWELTHKFIWTHKTCALLMYCLLITHLSVLPTVTQTTVDHKISRNLQLSRGCLWESFVSAGTGFFDGFLLLQLIVSVEDFFLRCCVDIHPRDAKQSHPTPQLCGLKQQTFYFLGACGSAGQSCSSSQVWLILAGLTHMPAASWYISQKSVELG